MANLDPLPSYTVRIQRLDPTLAELHIAFNDLPPDVEVQGRLIGPRCPGMSTIEVAYRLRPLSVGVYQVLIPEPVFWSADRPCVYEGPVELRRNDEILAILPVSVGIRSR